MVCSFDKWDVFNSLRLNMAYLQKNGAKYWLVFLILLALGSEAFSQSSQFGLKQEEVNRVVGEAVIPYVTALQSGDVKTIQDLIDGNLAVTLGKLLSDNLEYPNFLREKFGNNYLLDTKSSLAQKVTEVFVENDKGQGSGIMIVEMRKPDNSLVNLELSFHKDQEGKWKVVDQKIVQ